MIVSRLNVANVRAIKAAQFRFLPGFNLIVGVNGVGKTSVLHALSVCLSGVVKRTNKLRSRAKAFTADDIRIGAEVSNIECDVRIGDREYNYVLHKPRETSASQTAKVGRPREQVHATPEREEFVGDVPEISSGNEPQGRPLAVLFSTNRSVPSERAPRQGSATGGVDSAFADAFLERELRLTEFGLWMRSRQTLLTESPEAGRVLTACEDAVTRFLPGYKNLQLIGEDNKTLCIDRHSTTIPVRKLSDGERGILSLVLDLTRRLAQANPKIAAPTSESEAVVLIDEIDLHLHPKWQRQIVHNLTKTFPRCQFVATTHSPQVVASVEPDQVHPLAPR